MTQDEIIEMAREAGFEIDCCSIEWHKRITAFAHLLAAKALAQRTWVGLTDEEVFEICNSLYNRDSELVQMIEAKLKERNDHSI